MTNSSRTCIASIRPSTSPLSCPNSTICINSHSIETGLSAIRGGFTNTLGTVVSPASCASLTSLSNSIAVIFIRSRTSSDTRFTTNCPVSRIFRRVSFGRPGSWLPIPIPTTGGSPANPLKKENGAAFNCPCKSCVTIQAIGRGTIVETINLYRSRAGSVAKPNSIEIPPVKATRRAKPITSIAPPQLATMSANRKLALALVCFLCVSELKTLQANAEWLCTTSVRTYSCAFDPRVLTFYANHKMNNFHNPRDAARSLPTTPVKYPPAPVHRRVAKLPPQRPRTPQPVGFHPLSSKAPDLSNRHFLQLETHSKRLKTNNRGHFQSTLILPNSALQLFPAPPKSLTLRYDRT